MRPRRRFLRGLLFLLTLAGPALAQNLLVNPGFDRDLSGWTREAQLLPAGDVSATWTATDATGSTASGGLALHAASGSIGSAHISLSQCLAASEGRLVSFGARFLTASQVYAADTSVDVAFFESPDCNGIPLGSATATSLVPNIFFGTNSNGLWLPAASLVFSSSGTHSMRVSVSANAFASLGARVGSVDAVADDVYATAAPAAITTWILPAAAWVHGAAGSYWTTQFTLSNPGTTDAAVTLKWLGHDIDGRAGHEFTYVVRAGQTLTPDEETWSNNFPENWGAILVTSSSPALILQSETQTFIPGGGTVGQVLAAVASVDFIGAAPKTLAPVRDDSSFRTNLVLANATEAPLVAHVALFAADGTPLGARDVDLPPLGAKQIGGVGWSLAGTSVNPGRIAVSTPTPGGLVAAYASIIDNTTNDPRTLLPWGALASPSAATWILPSSATVSGAAGSSWTTTLTLANTGAGDALVTLKFLGRDGDGRSGDERSFSIRAGTAVSFPDVVGSLFARVQDFGAIRITSSSTDLAVESETSTPFSGGTVGQALPALGPADFAGAAPKTLAPIREDPPFRTNLVLANATEAPLVAHVALLDADGTLLGSRDVDLPPLGMTQLTRVAAALGVPTLDLGRIAVSTPTPGGLVAAYASVIDNTTNDPRTILPR